MHLDKHVTIIEDLHASENNKIHQTVAFTVNNFEVSILLKLFFQASSHVYF